MNNPSVSQVLSAIWNFNLFTVGQFNLHVSQLVVALLLLFATFRLSSFIKQSLNKLADRSILLDKPQAYMYSRLIHYAVLIFGFSLSISVLGVDLSHLTLIAGALGVGVGLGLQDIVKNFVSGVAIMLEKSLKVGDCIELNDGLVGEVKAISLRTTLIHTNDNIDVLVPNAELSNGRLTNWTLNDTVRRFRIDFSVAYGTDKELVKRAALEAASKVPYTLDTEGRRPVVWMRGFGDHGLEFQLGVWIGRNRLNRPARLKSDYLWALDTAFSHYGITVPFPQMDVHMVKKEHLRPSGEPLRRDDEDAPS